MLLVGYSGIFLVANILAAIGAAKDCSPISWNRNNNTCSKKSGRVEIYKLRNKDGESYVMCCKQGSQGEKRQTSRAAHCLPTNCEQKASHDDICPERTFLGKKVHVEEVLRDSCTLASGEEGVLAQCCVKNSIGGLLLTTLGAEMNEFPHQAALSVGCGGTIYNKRFILTAAHCVVNSTSGEVKEPSKVKVTLGTNIGGHSDFDSKEHAYQVENFIVHEKYSKLKGNEERNKLEKEQATYNDIALLRLTRDIKFGEEVKSLPVASTNFKPLDYSDSVVVVGWGTTDTEDLSQHLQKANFLLRKDSDCFVKGAWARAGNDKRQDKLLCIGGILNGVWSPIAGAGDSGGPAICRSDSGKPVLCGLSSYGGSKGGPCAQHMNENSCKPNVFTEVSYFRNWIEQHAGMQDPKTFVHAKLYGEDVPRGRYLHQVHITSTNGKSCGGTLISKDVVVTAAHCVLKNDGSLHKLHGIKVTAGIKDFKGERQTFTATKVVHMKGFQRIGTPVESRNYHKRGYARIFLTDNFHQNDLALVKLNGKVSIDEKHLPVLPSRMTSGDELAVEVSLARKAKHGTQMLMSRKFKILDKSSCQKRIDRLGAAGIKDLRLDNNVMCGVEKYSGGSKCDRELGGGLICQGDQGIDVLCGVQIFRTCEMAIPNGFIDMARVKNWVTMEMKNIK